MADLTYTETRYVQSPDNPSFWPQIRIVDLKDGTYANAFAEPACSYKRITGSAVHTIKSGSGTLVRIIVNKAVSITNVTVKNGTDIISLLSGLSGGVIEFNCAFTNGLTVQCGANDDITVIYR